MNFWESVRRCTLLKFSWVFALAYSTLNKDRRTLPALGMILLFQILINYTLATFEWHVINRFRKSDSGKGQLPPQYPSLIPYLGNPFSFIWDNAKFIRHVTNVLAKDRVDHITHQGFHRALSGPGLIPTSRRYVSALTVRLDEKRFSTNWAEMEDFSNFFRDVVSSSLIEFLYGPTMIRLNPEFMKELWGFDASVPWLARGVPSFIKPSAYKPRENCVAQLKLWYSYARKHFTKSSISPDGDGDPYWGSNLMRYRQEKLLAVKNHDDDALARMDLGLAWGSVGNTIPCAMLSAFHIFKGPVLLQRVRDEVKVSLGDLKLLEIDLNKFTKNPLLSSIYAETLRLYIKTYFMVSSPHVDVNLGKWTLSKGRIGLMNADRFLTDPTDPESGPVTSLIRASPDWVEPRREAYEKARQTNQPFFSLDGIEGAWFPYGGGYSTCPGRFLAKSVILTTCAILARDYDIEMLSGNIEMSTWRFGLGVRGLKHSLPFRIRKRSARIAAGIYTGTNISSVVLVLI
ncbi:65795566-4059-423b-9ce8-6320b22c028f [Sclerotinia trifoliorum]|uniref:65795566-4059-423b-9ce8-6320b22c028f n=1 Tax=Sclerotinia trifoliorum TaxID=28548 RepID=A0A8H2W040_9HELO|nr:65795566-4059-423b-9ce8-6320b22c028f [Sclerotinia trifoliorum]